MTIIEKIFCGNFSPVEKTPDSKESIELNKQFNDLYKQLESELNEKQWETLENLLDINGAIDALMGAFRFEQGFKTGMRLRTECEE